MDFQNSFAAHFETAEEMQEYQKKVTPLMAKLNELQRAINDTNDFNKKMKLLDQHREIKNKINALPIEIRKKARKEREKEREKERKAQEAAREKEWKAQEAAREKERRAHAKAVKKEKDIIHKQILAYLSKDESITRAEIKEKILAVNQFELVNYDEVEETLLQEKYEGEKYSVVHNSEDANRATLLRFAKLLGKSEKQVDSEIKKDLEEKAKKEEEKAKEELLQKKISKCNMITWGIILVLLIPQIIFLGWWTFLTGIVTLIIALRVKSAIIRKMK
jgi:hypothetical protein